MAVSWFSFDSRALDDHHRAFQKFGWLRVISHHLFFRRRALFAAGCVVVGLHAVAAQAQSDRFPTKPLRIVTAEVGGGNDYASRVIAAGLSAAFG